MLNPVSYIPVLSTLLCLVFSGVMFRRYLRRGRSPHLLWWTIGIFVFGVGTFTEAWTTLFGWSETIFRSWYISGALLGGAPLAQGTVYLLLKRRTANFLTVVVVTFICVAALFVLVTPINASLAEEHRLSGNVIEWTWVRAFSPFINTYAFIFLVGGAVYSALRYQQRGDATGKMWGNVVIAVGAILPGIGGGFTRAGYTEVLYVTEFIGIILIYTGYRLNTHAPGPSVHEIGASTHAASVSP